MPIMQEGHCCSFHWRERLILFRKYGIILLVFHPRTFIFSCALFNFFAAQWYLQFPNIMLGWFHCKTFCNKASLWQVSENYRIDGRIHTLSAALSLLNAREQIENGTIHADIHDVMSIKLHISYLKYKAQSHMESVFFDPKHYGCVCFVAFCVCFEWVQTGRLRARKHKSHGFNYLCWTALATYHLGDRRSIVG